jgi:hypothetical protein
VISIEVPNQNEDAFDSLGYEVRSVSGIMYIVLNSELILICLFEFEFNSIFLKFIFTFNTYMIIIFIFEYIVDLNK